MDDLLVLPSANFRPVENSKPCIFTLLSRCMYEVKGHPLTCATGTGVTDRTSKTVPASSSLPFGLYCVRTRFPAKKASHPTGQTKVYSTFWLKPSQKIFFLSVLFSIAAATVKAEDLEDFLEKMLAFGSAPIPKTASDEHVEFSSGKIISVADANG
jgi:hypothetical protein